MYAEFLVIYWISFACLKLKKTGLSNHCLDFWAPHVATKPYKMHTEIIQSDCKKQKEKSCSSEALTVHMCRGVCLLPVNRFPMKNIKCT